MNTYDVVVAGNGVLALSTARALALQDPSLRVAVVGPGARPGAASTAAGAMMGCFGEVTGPLLRSASGRAKFAKGRRAAGMWTSWLAEINAETGADAALTIRPGTFVIRNAKSGDIEDENFTAIQQALDEAEEPYEVVDPAGIPGLNPVVDCRASDALYLPREGSIDADRLIDALTALVARAPHQTLIDATVAGLEVGERITGVRLADGTLLGAGQVVLAMGAGTQAVLDTMPELAARIPRIFAGIGTSMLLDAPEPRFEHVVRTPNRSFACGLHVVPRAGSLYCGATNNVEIESATRTSPGEMSFLLDCVLDQMDQDLFTSPLIRWNVGNRPVTIDTCPLIGATSIEGLWLLTGTYRDGLFLSPLLGRHIAAQICGKPGLVDDDFRPEREPISVYGRDEARDYAVRHYLAMSWEHGMSLPRIGWHRALPRFYQEMVDRVYEQLEHQEFVLPPEFVGIAAGKNGALTQYFVDYLATRR